jgi:hypothetical protein
MEHAEKLRVSIIKIILRKLIRLFVTVINGDLSATIKNGSHFLYLGKVDPYALGDGKRNSGGIGYTVLVMKFRANPVYAVFLWMKILKAGFKPDYQEKKEAGSYSDCESEGIDERIAFITFQVSESGLEIIFKHVRVVVSCSCSMNMPVWKGLSQSALRSLLSLILFEIEQWVFNYDGGVLKEYVEEAGLKLILNISEFNRICS